jgi:hypothetical protein
MATSSMTAHAELLLNRSAHWSRGVRAADGLVFVLFTGSTGQTYMTTDSGCTCRGFLYRGQCAHQVAVMTEAEKAQAPKPRKRYEDLFGEDDLEAAW